MAANYPTEFSEQNIQNYSFDPVFQVLVAEMLGFDGTNLVRIQVDSTGRLVPGTAGSSDGYWDSATDDWDSAIADWDAT